MPCNVSIDPGEKISVDTGVSMELPADYFLQLHLRSSYARRDLELLGGVVDGDYRGNIKLFLRNRGSTTFRLKEGSRPVQGIICASYKMANDRYVNRQRGGEGSGSSGP